MSIASLASVLLGQGVPAGGGVPPASARQPPGAAPSSAAASAQSQAAVREFVGKMLNELGPRVGAVQFELDAVDGRAIVKVIDKETKTLIRQIPAPETLAVRDAIDHMQGILLRLKA